MRLRKITAAVMAASLVLAGCSAKTAETAPATAAETTKAAETTAAETTAEEKETEKASGAKAGEYQADVVVIGAGGAGMSAALRAGEAGASVIILEKMNYAGGNTTRSEGGMNAAATVFQKEKGIEDTVEAMVKDTMTGGKEINNPELVQYLAENSSDTIDWLTSIGMDLSDVAQGAGATNPRMHRSADGSKIGGVLVPILMENLEKQNIRILYSTEATELIKDGDAVTGVAAETADGSKLTFRANAVVVATGGFGANEDLYVKYRPDLKGFSTTNHPGATGDGIVLAEAVGADTVDMDKIQTNPTVEVNTQIVISESVRGKGAIFVNQSGERFTSEMQTRDVLSTAILEQSEKYAYLVFDQRVMDSMAALQENYEKGIIVKGDDIAGLADELEIDAAVLAETIGTWNKAVAQKKDDLYGRDTGMDEDLSRAPYYAVKVSPAVHYTMGGIRIDTQTQVIGTDGNVIPGLFAAGEVTGGVHGANRLGGNAVADIMVFGNQAGVEAAKYALAQGSLEAVLPEAEEAAVPTAAGNYKDGTYEATATGNNGDIKLAVEVKNGNIAAVNILEQVETPAIFGGVERDLIPQIIKTQGVEVDAIAGATVSSKAVLTAVEEALKAAK